jgi:FtsP/CotA-like multicopper oxidase with cupredoxin domain
MNHWQRIGTIGILSFVCVLLFACSSDEQPTEEPPTTQASPTAPQATVEPQEINLSAGEELALVGGFSSGGSDNELGYAVEGEEITAPGPTIKVRKGDTVTISFENAQYREDGSPDAVQHNFTVVADKDVPFAKMEPLWDAHVGGSGDPNLLVGESGSVTFTAEEAGSYYYVCAILDHAERGMWGRFEVVE